MSSEVGKGSSFAINVTTKEVDVITDAEATTSKDCAGCHFLMPASSSNPESCKSCHNLTADQLKMMEPEAAAIVHTTLTQEELGKEREPAVRHIHHRLHHHQRYLRQGPAQPHKDSGLRTDLRAPAPTARTDWRLSRVEERGEEKALEQSPTNRSYFPRLHSPPIPWHHQHQVYR